MDTHERTTWLHSPYSDDLLHVFNQSLNADTEDINICEEVNFMLRENFLQKQICDAQDSLFHMLFETAGFVKPSAYYFYNTDGTDTFTVNLQ